MSLDFWLCSTKTCPNCGHHIGTERVVFERNITHNLSAMAGAAGIYEALWCPEELIQPDVAAVMHDAEKQHGYHSEQATALRAELASKPATAAQLIASLRMGLAKLKASPNAYREHDAPNGRGKYENFVPFVESVLAACEEYPTANVKVSR